MEWQLPVMLGLGVLAAVLVMHTIFVAYPRYELSVYRYQLWGLRDELWDRHVLGDLQGDASAGAMIEQLEQEIRHAEDFKLGAAVLAARIVGRVPERRREVARLRREALGAAMSPAVAEIREKAAEAGVRYLTRGSVLGWTLKPARRLWWRVLRSAFVRSPESEPKSEADFDRRFFSIVAALGAMGSDANHEPMSSFV